jgi:hypothetical protein
LAGARGVSASAGQLGDPGSMTGRLAII